LASSNNLFIAVRAVPYLNPLKPGRIAFSFTLILIANKFASVSSFRQACGEIVLEIAGSQLSGWKWFL